MKTPSFYPRQPFSRCWRLSLLHALTRLAQSRWSTFLGNDPAVAVSDYLLEHPEVKVSTGVVDALNAELTHELEKKVKQYETHRELFSVPVSMGDTTLSEVVIEKTCHCCWHRRIFKREAPFDFGQARHNCQRMHRDGCGTRSKLATRDSEFG